MNNKVNNIIEKDEINIKIYFKYDVDVENRKLNIYKEDISEKQLDFLNSFVFQEDKDVKTCKTIKSFTNMFPDLNKYANSIIETKNVFVESENNGNSNGNSNVFDINEDMTEILTNESKVAVYGFDVETPAIGDGTLYNLSITLGTIDSGININDENCKVSGGANDLDFCAINKFNITALASGGRKND